jgi:hypothetical protein
MDVIQGTTMNINNPKGTESNVSSDKKVRRTFLKRAAAGAVLTSLPAHSVWGAVCSVSGAMSGNLSGIQRHSECEKPDLPAGRSPGTWKNLVLLHSSKVHAVFTSAPNPGSKLDNADAIRTCYMQNARDVAMNNEMVISPELIDLSFVTNIYDALVNSGGADYNMAAVWLNVYFGLGLGSTSIPRGAASANSVVERLLSYIQIQINNGTPVPQDETFYNFVDGYTDFEISECAAAQPLVQDDTGPSGKPKNNKGKK